MSYTISDLKTELAAVFHGTTLNKVQALDNLINRAARKLLSDMDPMETKRQSEITNAIYDMVYDYPIPADLKGDRVIDIKPQVNRQMNDLFYQTYNEQFDLQKADVGNTGLFTIQYNTAVKTIRIAKNLLNPVLLNYADSLNNNGTWAVGGTASNLSVNTLNYVAGSGSLQYDLAAGGAGSVGWVENSTMTVLDLTVPYNQGALFLYQYIPSALNVTNYKLRWGSSATDYYEQTVTAAQNNVAFQNGWNLLNFDWRTASITGAPDYTAINYLRVTTTYDGTAIVANRTNDITAQLGAIYLIEYYSKFLFRDGTTGVFQENVTDDSNIINLDTDSYNILFNCVAYFVAQQVQGSNSTFDSKFFLDEYTQAKDRYVAKIRSEVIKPQQFYYTMPPRNADSLGLYYP